MITFELLYQHGFFKGNNLELIFLFKFLTYELKFSHKFIIHIIHLNF